MQGLYSRHTDIQTSLQISRWTDIHLNMKTRRHTSSWTNQHPDREMTDIQMERQTFRQYLHRQKDGQMERHPVIHTSKHQDNQRDINTSIHQDIWIDIHPDRQTVRHPENQTQISL